MRMSYYLRPVVQLTQSSRGPRLAYHLWSISKRTRFVVFHVREARSNFSYAENGTASICTHPKRKGTLGRGETKLNSHNTPCSGRKMGLARTPGHADNAISSSGEFHHAVLCAVWHEPSPAAKID